MSANEDIGNLGMQVMDDLSNMKDVEVKNVGIVMSAEYTDDSGVRQGTVLYRFKETGALEVTGLLEYIRRAIFKGVGL